MDLVPWVALVVGICVVGIMVAKASRADRSHRHFEEALLTAKSSGFRPGDAARYARMPIVEKPSATLPVQVAGLGSDAQQIVAALQSVELEMRGVRNECASIKWGIRIIGISLACWYGAALLAK